MFTNKKSPTMLFPGTSVQNGSVLPNYNHISTSVLVNQCYYKSFPSPTFLIKRKTKQDSSVNLIHIPWGNLDASVHVLIFSELQFDQNAASVSILACFNINWKVMLASICPSNCTQVWKIRGRVFFQLFPFNIIQTYLSLRF